MPSYVDVPSEVTVRPEDSSCCTVAAGLPRIWTKLLASEPIADEAEPSSVRSAEIHRLPGSEVLTLEKLT